MTAEQRCSEESQRGSRHLRSFAIVLLFLVAATAQATSYTWNVGSGNWNTAANWNPSGVPGSAAGDTATLPTGSYTVTVNSAIANAVTLNEGCSSCTLDIPSGSLSLTGSSAVTTGALQISGGTLSVVNAADTL